MYKKDKSNCYKKRREYGKIASLPCPCVNRELFNPLTPVDTFMCHNIINWPAIAAYMSRSCPINLKFYIYIYIYI